MITENIDGVTYDFTYLKGTIVGKEKDKTTHIHSSGGIVNTTTGYSSPVRIHSSTTTTEMVFLQDDNGQEYPISITGWDLACREGHKMIFVLLSKSSSKTNTLVAVRNFTTGYIRVSTKRLNFI